MKLKITYKQLAMIITKGLDNKSLVMKGSTANKLKKYLK